MNAEFVPDMFDIVFQRPDNDVLIAVVFSGIGIVFHAAAFNYRGFVGIWKPEV